MLIDREKFEDAIHSGNQKELILRKVTFET
jgi:hypothetical protein